MKTNEQKLIELRELTKPAMRWLEKNCNPHQELRINSDSVVLKENVVGFQRLDLMKSKNEETE